MNRTKIEWCSHTWNPVTGCLHNCVYCYARDIAWRFRHKSDSDERVWWEEMGWVKYTSKHPKRRTMFTLNELFTDMGYRFPFGFAPTFHRYRLGAQVQRCVRLLYGGFVRGLGSAGLDS